MSTDKKYYYLKLKDNYFDQDNVKVLESMENGHIYSLIILKLYLKALKAEGQLMMTERIPYDPKKIEVLAKVINHDPDHVKAAISTAKELDIIEIVDTGEMYMRDIQNFIGHSSTEADRKREYRLQLGHLSMICPDKNPPEKEIELDIDIDIDIEKEIAIKSEDCKKHNPPVPTIKQEDVLLSKIEQKLTAFNILRDFLEEKSLKVKGEKYYHDVKEASCLSKLVKRASVEVVKSKIEILCKKIGGDDKFWREQPVCPSSILGLWNRLAVTVDKHKIKSFEGDEI